MRVLYSKFLSVAMILTSLKSLCYYALSYPLHAAPSMYYYFLCKNTHTSTCTIVRFNGLYIDTSMSFYKGLCG